MTQKVMITLTDAQFAELEPIREAANAEAANAEAENKPGMMLGQLWGHRVVFAFVPHERAKLIQLHTTDEKVMPGDMGRTGYENDH